MAIWLLSLVVLQNGYTGVLTSLMSVPKLDPIFNTLEEVIADGRYRITDQKNSVMTNQFLVSYYLIPFRFLIINFFIFIF